MLTYKRAELYTEVTGTSIVQLKAITLEAGGGETSLIRLDLLLPSLGHSWSNLAGSFMPGEPTKPLKTFQPPSVRGVGGQGGRNGRADGWRARQGGDVG